MIRYVKILTKVQFCNLFGLNEARFSFDSKKKGRFILLSVLWGILGAALIFYVGALTTVYVSMGLADIVPLYLSVVTSVVILFFAIFKAGSVIFQMKTYEMLVSLPLPESAIVISRFLRMYGGNLALSLLIMFPGLAVYGWFVHPGAAFYLLGTLGTIFLPLLPMTAAVGLGAVVTAVGSRMRHKNLMISLLSILLAVGIIAGNFWLSSNSSLLTADKLGEWSMAASRSLSALYPPALWFSEGIQGKNLAGFFLFLAVSILLFVLVMWLVQRNFGPICRALNGQGTKGRYQVGRLQRQNKMKALVKREMKRYFASSIYVSNTLIGYVMMVAAAAALLVLGAESLEDMIGIEGLIEKGAPFVFAGLAGLGSTTANSISLEGKQWWILKSLPLKGRDILNGKLLVNLTIAAPFYLLTVILACIAIRQVASPSAYLWMILLPLLYILWMAVVGLSFNLRMPVMDWENEVTVVKQSAAAMLTVLVGFLSIGLPLLAVWAVPEPFSFWVTVLIAAALCCGIGILYHRMGKADLRNIE